MGTRTLIYLSAAFFTGVAFAAGESVIAAISITGHIIVLMLHSIEVKLNKLLDNRRIYVTDSELND